MDLSQLARMWVMSSEPLFTLKTTAICFGLSEQVLLSIYNSRKVILRNSHSKEFELRPEGFGEGYSEDRDFLRRHVWEPRQSNDKTYTVYAKIRTLGGGNSGSTQNGTTKLPKAKEDVLREFAFRPEKYNKQDEQKDLFRRICIGPSNERQIEVLNILLNDLNIPFEPEAVNFFIRYPNRPVNLGALKVFFDKGFKHNQLDLNDVVERDLFPLFKEAMDTDPNLSKGYLANIPICPIFYKTDKLNNYRQVAFFNWMFLMKLDDSKYFDYFIKTQDLNQKIDNPQESLMYTLMFLLNDPEKFDTRLRTLLKFNPSLELCNHQGRTPLFTLFMSAKATVFEKTLKLLMAHGLKLNNSLNEGYTQFTYCLHLLLDLDLKNPHLQLLLNSDLLNNVAHMIKLGADYAASSRDLYFSLPEFYLTLFEKSILDNPPPNLSTSRSTILDKFLYQFPADLFGLIHRQRDHASEEAKAFKTVLEKAFIRSNLSSLFLLKEKTWQASLFVHLNDQLKNPLSNGVQNTPLFEEMVSDILNAWKNKQQKEMSTKLGGVKKEYANEKERLEAEEKAKAEQEEKDDEIQREKERKAKEEAKKLDDLKKKKEQNDAFWRSYETNKWVLKH